MHDRVQGIAAAMGGYSDTSSTAGKVMTHQALGSAKDGCLRTAAPCCTGLVADCAIAMMLPEPRRQLRQRQAEAAQG